jgi:hypothetical protein
LALGADLDAPWAKLRAAEQEFSGPGTFLGDYLCAVGRSRAAVDRAEALARLAVRMLGEKNDSACAAVMLAISRGRDAEPQTVRLGKQWVVDGDGRELQFVPIHHWRLDELATFEHYLRQMAESALAEDSDDEIKPLIVGPKQTAAERLTARPMTRIEEPSAPSAEEIIVGWRAAARILATLSPQERELINLLVEQVPADQICQRTGVKPGALRTRLSRLRKNVISRL